MQTTRGLIRTIKNILKACILSLLPNHYPTKKSPLPLPKKPPSYKIIAFLGNEEKGAGESYHTSGPPRFIMYLQTPAKNWCYVE